MRGLALAVAASIIAPSCTTGVSLTISAAAGGPAEVGVEVLADAKVAAVSTASTTTVASTTTTTEPARPVTLGFVGDVHMIRDMSEGHPLTAVAPLLSAPDLTFANLETVVGDADEVGRPPIGKEFIFRSPPATVDIIAAAGVDVVGMANNHAWDYGPTGAASTVNHVAASDLVGVGVGATPDAAYAPAYFEVEGQTVGVVSVSRVPCDWSSDPSALRPEVAWACDRFDLAALSSIATASEASDITVVMLHGGVEVTNCPGSRLREVIDVWVELGADVVSISHPHVLQGVEIVDGAAVLWSTGNFAFVNNGGRTGRSAVFEVTIAPDVPPEVRVVPTVLPRGQAEPADADQAATVFAEISERSRGGSVGTDGVLRADLAPSLCD